MYQFALLLGLALSPGTPEQEATPLDEETKDNLYKMAEAFAACAGVWDFISQYEAHGERPASAKQARETATGALLSATYIASMIHHAENPESQKPYGEFTPIFEGRRETSLTHMHAMVEREDVKGIEARIAECGDMLDTQEEIVSEIRRGFAR